MTVKIAYVKYAVKAIRIATSIHEVAIKDNRHMPTTEYDQKAIQAEIIVSLLLKNLLVLLKIFLVVEFTFEKILLFLIRSFQDTSSLVVKRL